MSPEAKQLPTGSDTNSANTDRILSKEIFLMEVIFVIVCINQLTNTLGPKIKNRSAKKIVVDKLNSNKARVFGDIYVTNSRL